MAIKATEKYAAYNRMYKNGKPTGRAYMTATGKTAAEAKRKALNGNRKWNKFEEKSGYKVKLESVKLRTKTKKRTTRPKMATMGFDSLW